MNVVFKVILVLTYLLSAKGKAAKFDNYEPRRPIKYLYHLLELKAGIEHHT